MKETKKLIKLWRNIVNAEELEKEATSKLAGIIDKYNINETLEDLMFFYSSVYIHKDYKQKRIRLLGIKEYTDQKTGKKVKKTVQLYVLSKRMIQTLPEENVFEISNEMSDFVYYFTLLKQIEKLRKLMETKDIAITFNSMSEDEYLLLKNN